MRACPSNQMTWSNNSPNASATAAALARVKDCRRCTDWSYAAQWWWIAASVVASADTDERSLFKACQNDRVRREITSRWEIYPLPNLITRTSSWDFVFPRVQASSPRRNPLKRKKGERNCFYTPNGCINVYFHVAYNCICYNSINYGRFRKRK